MSKSAIAKSVLIAGGLVGLVPSFAIGAEQTGLDIADNDSVYIDGKTFQITPGKAKADTAVQIKNLSARELGPGAIVIRSGDKLYIADGQGQAVAVAPSYAYDPQSSRPVLSGGGSFGYNQNAATNYAYDPQAYPIRNPNPWANNYAYDPQAFPMRNPDPWANNYAYDPRRGTQPAMLYDSDYVEYRLKKAFQDNWTPVAAN